MKYLNIILSFIICLSPLTGVGFNDQIAQVPAWDGYLMRVFADESFIWNQTAHPIFFINKPCSLCSIDTHPEFSTYRCSILLSGWKTFKKHSCGLIHSNFIFSEAIDKYGIDIFIINKQALKKCIDKHLNTFRSILGSHFSYDRLVLQLENKINLNDIIQNNKLLLGIVLGYGEEASRAYENHNDNCWDYGLVNPELYTGISANLPSKCPFFPVAFMGNPQSKEVQKLTKEYYKEIMCFWGYYQLKDPLILFLEGLCRHQSNVLPGLYNTDWALKAAFPNYVHLHMFSIFPMS